MNKLSIFLIQTLFCINDINCSYKHVNPHIINNKQISDETLSVLELMENINIIIKNIQKLGNNILPLKGVNLIEILNTKMNLIFKTNPKILKKQLIKILNIKNHNFNIGKNLIFIIRINFNNLTYKDINIFNILIDIITKPYNPNYNKNDFVLKCIYNILSIIYHYNNKTILKQIINNIDPFFLKYNLSEESRNIILDIINKQGLLQEFKLYINKFITENKLNTPEKKVY